MQRNTDFDYIIVGAGLSGLNLAKELTKRKRKVLVLEKGRFLNKLGKIIYAATFYDKYALAKSKEGVFIYRVFGVGGASIVSCANAIEPSQKIKEDFKKFDIDFEKEIEETKRECQVGIKNLPVGKTSLKIMEVANKLGYETKIMPKFGASGKCRLCGRCILGCKWRVKWTALKFLESIDKENLKIVTNFNVERIIISNGKVKGVEGNYLKIRRKKFYADRIILAAGGIGTPIILQNSGIDAGSNLFVDYFNITYGVHSSLTQKKEPCMSVVCDKFYQDEGFILSPCVDNFVGFLSSVERKYLFKVFKLNQTLGIMTKIKDEENGKVFKNGMVEKAPTQNDLEKLRKGSEIAKEILIECGVFPQSIIVTKPRGAHPGGTAKIGEVVDNKLETTVKNLFVCDASVFPSSLGIPPILTIIALGKWFVKNVLEGNGGFEVN